MEYNLKDTLEITGTKQTFVQKLRDEYHLLDTKEKKLCSNKHNICTYSEEIVLRIGNIKLLRDIGYSYKDIKKNIITGSDSIETEYNKIVTALEQKAFDIQKRLLYFKIDERINNIISSIDYWNCMPNVDPNIKLSDFQERDMVSEIKLFEEYFDTLSDKNIIYELNDDSYINYWANLKICRIFFRMNLADENSTIIRNHIYDAINSIRLITEDDEAMISTFAALCNNFRSDLKNELDKYNILYLSAKTILLLNDNTVFDTKKLTSKELDENKKILNAISIFMEYLKSLILEKIPKNKSEDFENYFLKLKKERK